MALSHLRILIQELLNKDPYIVTEEAPLMILDSESAVYMSNNGKYTNHTRHIYRRVHWVRNGKKFKMHKIGWCEEGLQLEHIENKKVGGNCLSPRVKCIMVSIDNL